MKIQNAKIFYVYFHRTNAGRVFYVGKGKGRRAWDYLKRNPMWQCISKKHGLRVEIVARDLSESDAFDKEIDLIRYHRQFGKLANMCDGGPGVPGYEYTPYVKKKMSDSQRGRKHTPETRQRMSEAKRGIAFWPKGKKRPPEFGQAVTARRKGIFKQSPATLEKMRVARLGTKHSLETIRKMKVLRANGNVHNSRPLVVMGEQFPSMHSFARTVGVTPLTVKKWVDAGKISRIEQALTQARHGS